MPERRDGNQDHESLHQEHSGDIQDYQNDDNENYIDSPLGEGSGAKSGSGFNPSDRGKIFIGGLSWETTSESLISHFGKYGTIIDSVIMKDRATGHPRGFGFVTYSDPEVCDTVVKDKHVIDGRTVEAKKSVPRENMAVVRGPRTKKIFVGGIPPSISDEEFKSYFSKYGKVVEHQIMQDHSSGRSRGFGFVTFENEQIVEEILNNGKMHELGGKQVEIKKAEPKRSEGGAASSSSSRGLSSSMFSSRAGYGGGGYGAYDGYGSMSSFGMYGRSGFGSRGYGAGSYGYGYGGSGGYGGYGGSASYGGYGSGYSGMGAYGSGMGNYGGSMMGGYGDDGYGPSGYGGYGGYGSGYGGYGGYGSSRGSGSGGYGSGTSSRYHPYGRN